MERVLIISTIGIGGYEGMSSVIYNFLSNMHTNEMEIDVTVYEDIRSEVLSDFEKIAGIKYVHDRKQSFLRYLIDLKKLFQNYNIVHINGNSSTMLIEYYLARICRVKKIILHNHSASTEHPIFNKITRPLIRKAKAIKLACSKTSGEWLFGEENYEVLNNAISIERFEYNESNRAQIRKSLNIGNRFFVGHIGHFTTVKNHEFIIDVFEKFIKMRPDAVLGLVSDGPLLEKIKIKVQERNLEDKVLFLGRQQMPECFYSSFDAFLFPSISEGFGLVAVEAQASGLPVLASTGVPKETQCSDIISYKDLSDGIEAWAKELWRISQLKIDRNSSCWKKNITEAGYDLQQKAEQLTNIYLNNEV